LPGAHAADVVHEPRQPDPGSHTYAPQTTVPEVLPQCPRPSQSAPTAFPFMHTVPAPHDVPLT
jgi:hypothetical protein